MAIRLSREMKQLILVLLFLGSCVPVPQGSKGDINLGKDASLGLRKPEAAPKLKVTSVEIDNSGQLVINGEILDKVKQVQINRRYQCLFCSSFSNGK